jgi:uncharacterized tellurite resistance protein B-like protein
MLDRIKALLLQGGLREEAVVSFSERDVATVCLLLEAASADGAYGETEHARILSLVETRMKLTPERARALLAEADRRHLQAVEVFKFTDAARKNLNENERIGLVEMLWEVVYADASIDEFEDRLLRKVAGLLHVSDIDRAEARARVLARSTDGRRREDFG